MSHKEDLEMVKQDGRGLEAVKQNERTLQFVEELTNELLRFAALEKDGWALKHIGEQTEGEYSNDLEGGKK